MNAQFDRDSRQIVPLVFDEEVLGLSLRELAVDVIRGERMDFLSRWFQSPKQEADLFIWIDTEKRLVKSQLCLFGQVVEWNPLDGTRTGVIVEEEIFGVEDDDVSETIRFDARVQSHVIDQAVRVLRHVPGLGDEERALVIHNLRESPKLHKLARERAIRAWAPRVEDISSNRRPTFWRRLKKWVLG